MEQGVLEKIRKIIDKQFSPINSGDENVYENNLPNYLSSKISELPDINIPIGDGYDQSPNTYSTENIKKALADKLKISLADEKDFNRGFAENAGMAGMGSIKSVGKSKGLLKNGLSKLEDILPNTGNDAIDDIAREQLRKNPEKYKEYLKALDDAYGSKDLRSKDMGFSEKDYYHGSTKDIDKFDINKAKQGTFGKGIYFAENNDLANAYGDRGSVYPVRLQDSKLKNYKDVLSGDDIDKISKHLDPRTTQYLKYNDDIIPNESTAGSAFRKISRENAESPWGKENDPLKNISNELNISGISIPDREVAIYDPSKIRSKFAAFDPRFKNSKDILAGAGGAAVGLGLLSSPDSAQASEETMGKIDFQPIENSSKGKIDFVAMDDSVAQEPSLLDKKVPIIGGTVRGYTKGALNTLPTVGAVGGGLLGSSAGPIGAVAGAGLGAGAGESLKNIGEKYILGEDKTREQIYADPAKQILSGVTAEMGGQAVGAGLKAAADTKIGQKALSKAGDIGARIGETFSGVPSQEIKTYAKNADEIKAMAKSSDNSTAEAADQMRDKFTKSIDKVRMDMNNQISNTLKSSQKTVPIGEIKKSIENAKSVVNENLYPEQIKQIDDMISKIESLADKSGNLSLSDAHDIKSFLQDQASTAYRYPGEFSIGTKAANAVKSGAATARDLINVAEPKVAAANNKLAELHNIYDDMNMNLIREGKPESALMAAGSGGNSRNALNLQKLGDFTETDMLSDAQKLAAMRTFGSPKLMAMDTTGKAVGRMGLAGGIGLLTGGPGAAVGAAAITSPAAVKVAIESGLITKKALQNPQIRTLMSKGLLNKAEKMLSQKEQEK
jgi:hypothetical protein